MLVALAMLAVVVVVVERVVGVPPYFIHFIEVSSSLFFLIDLTTICSYKNRLNIRQSVCLK